MRRHFPIVVVLVCRTCDRSFEVLSSQLKGRGRGTYCSRACYAIGQKRPLSERFWKKVVKSDGCWLWTGATGANGYGVITTDGRGTPPIQAHRVSWQLHYGPIPVGLLVCHHCDVRRCVRPDHLFLGTNAENLADMRRKGRGYTPTPPHGADNLHAKLTEELVVEIRRRYAEERSAGRWRGVVQDLAADYGIHRKSIHDIVAYRTWKHVP
jgi:HNH endonuclease